MSVCSRKCRTQYVASIKILQSKLCTTVFIRELIDETNKEFKIHSHVSCLRKNNNVNVREEAIEKPDADKGEYDGLEIRLGSDDLNRILLSSHKFRAAKQQNRAIPHPAQPIPNTIDLIYIFCITNETI